MQRKQRIFFPQTYLVFDCRLGAVLHENFGQFSASHCGRNMKRRVIVLCGCCSSVSLSTEVKNFVKKGKKLVFFFPSKLWRVKSCSSSSSSSSFSRRKICVSLSLLFSLAQKKKKKKKSFLSFLSFLFFSTTEHHQQQQHRFFSCSQKKNAQY